MSTTNHEKFKGEIENYLNKGFHNFESKIDIAFSALKFKTWLCKANIVKKDGYHACHLLFILVILPFNPWTFHRPRLLSAIFCILLRQKEA